MKDEIQKIRKMFSKADYPRSFVKSVTSLYNNKIKEQKIDNDEDYIIPPYLFEHKKPFILLKLLFREQNELKPKDFIEKFHKFTNDNFWLHSISAPPITKKKNKCLGGLKRVPAMNNCLGAYYVYCPKTRLLKIKYGSKGSISNVDLGLF